MPLVFVPGPEAQTITQALALVPGDVEVRLASGVFHENLVIRGERRVRLRGAGMSGPAATRVVAADERKPVVDVRGGVELQVDEVRFEGGDAGLQGAALLVDCGPLLPEAVPGRIVLNRVAVRGARRGVTGTFSTIEISDVDVSACTWHGLSIAAESLIIQGGQISGNDGAGLYVNNVCAGDVPIRITDVLLTDNGLGGLIVVGGGREVQLRQVRASANTIVGIQLVGVSRFVAEQCQTTGNIADDGLFGDGLIASSSHGFVLDSSAALNARAGYAVFSSGVVELSQCTLAYNPVNMNMETGGLFVDFGGNCCDTVNPCGPCHALSSTFFEPPPPPP